WTDAGPARGDEALILALAINAQAFGALPFDPDHERLSVHFHPVVHVGNAAANRRGCQGRRLSPYGDAGHSLLDRDGQGIRYGPMTGWRRPAVAWDLLLGVDERQRDYRCLVPGLARQALHFDALPWSRVLDLDHGQPDILLQRVGVDKRRRPAD